MDEHADHDGNPRPRVNGRDMPSHPAVAGDHELVVFHARSGGRTRIGVPLVVPHCRVEPEAIRPR